MSQDEVKELLAQLKNQVQPGNQEGFEGWQKPQPSAFGVQGVNVPVSVQTSAGKVRVYFQLPAEVASSPEALIQALENMLSMGIPVDAWQGNQNRNNWGQGSGYNNNRGYRRRW
jgi:hypothetical protein